MKTLKLLVGKEFLGERLGLEDFEFAITDVQNGEEGVTLTILTDDNTKVNNQFVLSDYEGNNHHLRRQNINEEQIKGSTIDINKYEWDSEISDLLGKIFDKEVLFKGETPFTDALPIGLDKNVTINVNINSDFKTTAEEIAKDLSEKFKVFKGKHL